MAWEAPRTWAAGDLLTSAIMNRNMRENMNVSRAAGAVVLLEDADPGMVPKRVVRLEAGALQATRGSLVLTVMLDQVSPEGFDIYRWMMPSSGAARRVKVEVSFPDGAKWSMEAFIRSVTSANRMGDLATAEIELMVQGLTTYKDSASLLADGMASDATAEPNITNLGDDPLPLGVPEFIRPRKRFRFGKAKAKTVEIEEPQERRIDLGEDKEG